MPEHRVVPVAWRPLDPIVLSADDLGETGKIELRVGQFAVSRTVSRALMADSRIWSEARMVMESQCQHELSRLLRTQGWIPLGPQEWEVIEDPMRGESRLLLHQTAVEDSSPIWLSVRAALEADQAWFEGRKCQDEGSET